MPRFMGFVRMEEGIGTPPQSLFEAMDAHIGERAAKGVFLDGGGHVGIYAGNGNMWDAPHSGTTRNAPQYPAIVCNRAISSGKPGA